MIIKVGDEYLDFGNDIEVERQAKLFEEIATVDGDYSFQFDIPATSNNVRLLGYPMPDNSSKRTYEKVDCTLLSDNLLPLYEGFIRIEGVKGDTIQCSFFSGNNNWFGLLSGLISDIDFSDLDTAVDFTTVLSYRSATEGIVFPVIDAGGLVTRGYNQMIIEDFVAGIYVKTIFKRIFSSHSIKIQGELINDVAFNSIITIKNGKSKDQINASSCFVEKSNTTLMPAELTRYKILWDNDSVYPYFDGEANSFDLPNSRWVAPYRMKIEIEVGLTYSQISGFANRIYVYINGVFTFVDIGLGFGLGGLYNTSNNSTVYAFLKREFVVEAGDILEIYGEWQESGTAPPPQSNAVSGSWKITPLFIYQTFGSSVIPNWTQQKFVSNILRIFNVVTSYDQFSKTLTFNLFDKIKGKEAINLSTYISETEVDYKDFISNYGKENVLSYSEVDFPDLRDYNVQNFFKYGQGVIEADNEFLETSKDIIESDFSNPLGYINGIFDMSIELINLVSITEDNNTDATSITDNAGIARFNIPNDYFLVGDVIRISESRLLAYRGDWVVSARGAGYVEFHGVNFVGDSNAKMDKLSFSYDASDDVYLLWNIPSYALSKVSSKAQIYWDTTSITTISTAYFNLLNTGRQVNQDYKQSLSFGEIADDKFYQQTMIDTYWKLFSLVINDPVKLLCRANLPYNIFLSIDFLQPIEIKTLETTNLYYLNKISGYKGREYASELQLIKLP